MEEQPKIINPLWTVGFFALLATIALLFSASETLVAASLVLYCLLITVMHPFNGIAFLLLVMPFFLGAVTRPYFWLLEIFIFVVIIIGLARLYIEKTEIRFPLKYIVLSLLAVTLISAPIDLKDFIYESWAVSKKEIVLWFMKGYPQTPINYLRIFLNILSGVGLFIITANYIPRIKKEVVSNLFYAIVVTSSIVCLIGIMFFYDIIPTDGLYMNLSLAGKHSGGISALAYNKQYFAQYLLLCLPAALFLVVKQDSPGSKRLFGVVAAGLIIFCLIQGGQKSAQMTIVFTAITSVIIYTLWFTSKDGVKRNYLVAALVVTGLIMAIVAIVKFNFLDKINLDHITHYSRYNLWKTAFIMFLYSPILGVGLGRFSHTFFEFFIKDHGYFASDRYYAIFGSDAYYSYIGYATGTAHSLYVQIMAEQGALGIICWSAVSIIVLSAGIRKVRNESDLPTRIIVAILMMMFLNILFLGLTHYIFHLRVIGIFYWIIAGIIVSIGFVKINEIRFSPSQVKAISIILIVAASYQAYLIYQRPVGLKMQAGYYRWEGQPDGSDARWMGKRSVMNAPSERDRLRLWLSAPMPGLDKRPQKVKIWYDGEQKEITLKDTRWALVELDVKRKAAKQNVLWVETDYVFNPKAANISGDSRDLGVMIKKVQLEPDPV